MSAANEIKEKDTIENTIADDLISRKWLLDEYDRRHSGPRGGAYQMIMDAPTVDFDDVNAAIDELNAVIENDAHPVVSPENYWLYCKLHDSLARLENALDSIRSAEKSNGGIANEHDKENEVG